MYYAIGFFVIGSVLILFSKQKWYWKALSLTSMFFSIGVVTKALFFETYVIPRNFTGPAYVITEPVNGERKKYNFFSRVYEIPMTGLLFTKFKQKPGFHIRKFYQIGNEGNRTELGQLDYRNYIEKWVINPPATEPSRDGFAVVTSELDYDFKTKTYRTVFTVGKYKDIHRWNCIPDEKIDSLKNEIIR